MRDNRRTEVKDWGTRTFCSWNEAFFVFLRFFTNLSFENSFTELKNHLDKEKPSAQNVLTQLKALVDETLAADKATVENVETDAASKDLQQKLEKIMNSLQESDTLKWAPSSMGNLGPLWKQKFSPKYFFSAKEKVSEAAVANSKSDVAIEAVVVNNPRKHDRNSLFSKIAFLFQLFSS